MTLISVLIVLAAEFYFHWGAEYRQFGWFDSLLSKCFEFFGDQAFFEGWGGLAIVLLAPVFVLSIIISLIPGFLYYPLLFLIACAVLFLSLGPKSLFESYKAYFEAMDRGDAEAGYLNLQKEQLLNDLPDSDELARNVTRSILIESQTRYFGVIFWFVFLGPYGALFYRLSHYYRDVCVKEAHDEHLLLLEKLIHIIDWAPARLTSLLFLLTGDFVNGFYRVKDFFVDFSADNHQLISETGIAALGLDMQSSDGDYKENRSAMAMIDRTVIIYLVVVAALTPLAFW